MDSNIYDRIIDKKEEALDEWNVIDKPSQDEMKNFRGTAPDPNLQYKPGHNTIASNGGQMGGCKQSKAPAASWTSKVFKTKEELCPKCNTHHQYFNIGNVFEVSWNGEPSEQEQENDKGKQKLTEDSRPPTTITKKESNELHPCTSCNGYHYTDHCVYLLPWTQWLEYHSTHMQSKPYPSPDSLPSHNLHERRRLRQKMAELDLDETDEGDLSLLQERALHLDLIEGIRRPNYISNTRLKADLMTKSSRDMFYEDEEWKARLEKGRVNGGSGTNKGGMAQRVDWELQIDQVCEATKSVKKTLAKD